MKSIVKYYYSVDAVKFICVVFVVLIHTTATIPSNDLATFGNYYFYRDFLDIAVPFFFAASGFFLSIKTKKYLKNYISKILYYYITFSLLYMGIKLVFLVLDRIFLKEAFWPALEELTSNWDYVSILNGTIGSFHLWFLTALLFSSLLLILLHDRGPRTILLIAVLASLILRIGILDFGSLFEHGGLPRGFLYVALGFYVGKTNIEIKQPLLWFFFYMLLHFLFSYFTASRFNEIFLFIATYYLMVFCKNHPGKETFLSDFGKKTLGVYILHFLIIDLIRRIFRYAGVDYAYEWYFYVIAGILGVVIPLLIFNPISRGLDKVFATPYRHFFN